MIIEAQIGQGTHKLELPDGSTPEQIDEVLSHYATEKTGQNSLQAQFDAKKGFAGRMDEDMNSRWQQIKDAQTREESGQQGNLSSILQIAGTGAGAALDTAGNVIGSAARYGRDAIPQFIDDAAVSGLDQAKNYIADSDFGRGAKYLIQEGAELAKEHPVTAANLGAVANIASLLPAVKATEQVVSAGAKGVKNMAVKEAAKPPILTSEELRTEAGNLYKSASNQGGVLKPHITNKFIDEIEALSPQTEKGRALVGDSAFTKLTEKIKTFRDTPTSLDEAQEIDKILGDHIDDFVDRQTGKVTEQGQKILNLQTTFRNTIDAAGEADVAGGKKGFNAIKDARAMWAKAAQTRDIEKILTRAEMTDNPATSIKAGFRTIATNPARLRGYSPEVRDAIQKAAKDGIITDTLRTVFGSRLISSAAGLAGGGIPGALAGNAASAAVRSGVHKLKSAQAENIIRAIQQGKKVSPAQIKALPAAEAKEALQLMFLNSANRKFLTNSTAASAGSN